MHQSMHTSLIRILLFKFLQAKEKGIKTITSYGSDSGEIVISHPKKLSNMLRLSLNMLFLTKPPTI
jgi:hypothetical protein